MFRTTSQIGMEPARFPLVTFFNDNSIVSFMWFYGLITRFFHLIYWGLNGGSSDLPGLKWGFIVGFNGVFHGDQPPTHGGVVLCTDCCATGPPGEAMDDHRKTMGKWWFNGI